MHAWSVVVAFCLRFVGLLTGCAEQHEGLQNASRVSPYDAFTCEVCGWEAVAVWLGWSPPKKQPVRVPVRATASPRLPEPDRR
ncbi:MAG: hypothetical protein KDA93_26905 [Planctomycetaceae bacterium]|nr:hypothetical protein [Planctomycetaceae bacterium]